MKRWCIDELIAWKNTPRRKPLLLLGARQVGKTWLACEFGRQHYKNVVYVRLGRDDFVRCCSFYGGEPSISRLLCARMQKTLYIVD